MDTSIMAEHNVLAEGDKQLVQTKDNFQMEKVSHVEVGHSKAGILDSHWINFSILKEVSRASKPGSHLIEN